MSKYFMVLMKAEAGMGNDISLLCPRSYNYNSRPVFDHVINCKKSGVDAHTIRP